MSQAAEQHRTWLEAEFPGVRISRRACRDTIGGSVSQHSSYSATSYDSNAIDVMGAPLGWDLTYKETQEYLDTVYAGIVGHEAAWSIRKILWRVADHYGHIHIDYWPTCLEPKWCGRRIVPRWAYSDGETFLSTDPEPENGRYDGPTTPEEPDMTYEQFRAAEFDLWTDENIMDAYDAGMFEDTNRVGFHQYWVVERDERTAPEKARFLTDFYSHLWKR